jgi:hypothetical protein
MACTPPCCTARPARLSGTGANLDAAFAELRERLKTAGGVTAEWMEAFVQRTFGPDQADKIQTWQDVFAGLGKQFAGIGAKGLGMPGLVASAAASTVMGSFSSAAFSGGGSAKVDKLQQKMVTLLDAISSSSAATAAAVTGD